MSGSEIPKKGASEAETEALAAAEPEIEPQRILFPSALGALGVELVEERITRVVIVPKGRDRSLFRPYADFKRSERSDFLDEVLGQFSEYLAGARSKLDVEYDLQPSEISGFPKLVLKATARIPFGRTRTYQQIANNIGNPGAYRQVLAVLLVNPLPLVIPCHRVVTAKSGPGSWVAGVKKKAWLLNMEARGLAV